MLLCLIALFGVWQVQSIPAYCEGIPFELPTPGNVYYTSFSYPESIYGCEWHVQAGDGMVASISIRSNISVESPHCRDYLYSYCLSYTGGKCDQTSLIAVCDDNYPCMTNPALQDSYYGVAPGKETNATWQLCPQLCNECSTCNYDYISVTGSDGVEYYRGCGNNPNTVTIVTGTQNATVRLVRGYLQQNKCRDGMPNSTCVDDFGGWVVAAAYDYSPMGPLDFVDFNWTSVSNGTAPSATAPCAGEVTITTAPGVITPSTATHYANNSRCTWVITAPPGQHVALRWRRFSLQASFGLRSRWHPQVVPGLEFADFVTIRDGTDVFARGPFAGTRIPANITSASQSFTIYFESDEQITSSSFELEYDFVPTPGVGPRFCSGNVTLTTPGTVSQDGPYPVNNTCVWRIEAPSGQFIKIDWNFLSIEGDFAACVSSTYDYLRFRDGNGKIIQNVCGQFLPPSVVSLTNVVEITFFSDMILVGDGFSFNYSFVSQPGPVPASCVPTLEIEGAIGSKGVIHDGILFGKAANPYRTCNWFVSGPTGSRIRLKFVTVRLARCLAYDFPEHGDNEMTVFDGQDLGASSLTTFCGDGAPDEVVTTSNQMVVRLRADGNMTDGLLAYYSIEAGPASPLAISCRAAQIIGSGTSGLLVDGNLGNGPSNCSWRFTAPINQYVQFTLLNFSIGTGDDGCSKKWFAAYDGASEMSFPYFSTCGVRIIPGGIATSTTRDVLIRFVDEIGDQPNLFYIEWAFVSQPGNHTRCFSPIIPNQILGPSTTYTSFAGRSLNQTSSLMTYFRRGLFCAWRIPILDATSVTIQYKWATWSGVRTDLGMCGDYLEISTDDSLTSNSAVSTLCSNANSSTGLVLGEALDVPTISFRFTSDVYVRMQSYQDFQFALDIKYEGGAALEEGGLTAGYVAGIVFLVLLAVGILVAVGCYCQHKKRTKKEADPAKFDLARGQNLGTSGAAGESSFNFGRSSAGAGQRSDD